MPASIPIFSGNPSEASIEELQAHVIALSNARDELKEEARVFTAILDKKIEAYNADLVFMAQGMAPPSDPASVRAREEMAMRGTPAHDQSGTSPEVLERQIQRLEEKKQRAIMRARDRAGVGSAESASPPIVTIPEGSLEEVDE